MPRAARPVLSSRKQPRQARSSQMVADILEASIRVLRRDGGLRFNTVRVAAAAGISVGSLYQYFPNKASLLFRLQMDEWAETASLIADVLGDRSRPPVARLRRAVIEFFRTEAREAELRRALDDVSALFRDSPEARRQRDAGRDVAVAFFREALPRRRRADVVLLADLFSTALSAIAERVTSRELEDKQLERWAEATADLLCGHLERLAR